MAFYLHLEIWYALKLNVIVVDKNCKLEKLDAILMNCGAYTMYVPSSEELAS